MNSHSKQRNALAVGLPAAIMLLFSMASWSITPLDEKSMDNVSAQTSSFVLNLYGSSKAGLTAENSEEEIGEVEIEPGKTAYKEGEEAAPIATQELETIEKEASASTAPKTESTIIESNLVTEVIESTQQLVQENESFDSSKHIRFKPNGHHHESHILGDDSVLLARDIHVEMLEFQRLRSDEAGDGGFGNLYLSDWNSRGNTTINITE